MRSPFILIKVLVLIPACRLAAGCPLLFPSAKEFLLELVMV